MGASEVEDTAGGGETAILVEVEAHPAIFALSKIPSFRAKNGREMEHPAIARSRLFAMKKNVWRPVVEVGFIIFLFYANLLMGEFERSGMGQRRGIAWAIVDVFTAANFTIAMIAALIGYVLFEFLRKKL